MSDEQVQPDATSGPTPRTHSLREALRIFPGADHFEILGVTDADRTPERIVSALQDQLTKLNGHPDAESSEADQLRMTLHAAAADAIRDVLSARNVQAPSATPVASASPTSMPRTAVTPPTPRAAPRAAPANVAAANAPPMQGSPVALEAMAHMILGMHGGWNEASRRHLMLLARTHGASPDQLVRTMQGMTRRGEEAASQRPAPPPVAAAARGPIVPAGAPVPVASAHSAPAPSAPAARPTPTPSRHGPLAPVASIAPMHAGVPDARASPQLREPRAQKATISEDEAIARVRAIAREQPDPTRRLLLIIGVGGAVVILLLAVLLVAAIALSKAKKATPTPAPVATAGAPAPTPPSPAPSPTGPAATTRDPNIAAPAQPPKPLFETPKPNPATATPAQPTSATRAIRRWDDMLRDLRGLAETASSDRAATVDQFAKLFAEMGRSWVETTPDGHAAAADAVVELLFRISGDRESMQRLLAAIDAATTLDPIPRAEQIRSRAFAGGVIARMARERDLPSLVRGRIDEMAPRILGPSWTGSGATFRMGAVGALSESSGALLPPVVDPDAANRSILVDAWREWVRDIDAAEQGRTQEGTRRLLQGLEDVMLRGPDAVVNRATYEVIGQLAVSLTWRDGDASRDRLIRWFDAPGINASDLHALTSALANSSSASSIDLSMVLSPTADAGQRAVLRDRYAAVWSLSAAGARTAQVQELIQRARGAIDFPGSDPPSRLANGAYMSHLNAVASYAWAGEPFPSPLFAGPSVVSAPSVPLASLPPGSTVTFTNPGGASAAGVQSTWGVQYLAVGPNIPARRELLQRVVGPLTKLDASILANEAMRGSPQQIRQEAMTIARKFVSDAAMIDALLELAPQIPATIDNTELLEAATGVPLPAPRDAAWRLEVRRALVARLLELLGGKALKEVDQLSSQFADAYAAAVNQANPPKDPSGARVVIDPPAAGVSAIALRSLWQRRAAAVLPSGREPITLAQINAARPARLRLARTPIQAVSVEQANIAELMAFVVVAERPDTAPDAATILSDLGQQRARAEHIFDQLEAGERAILRLWLLRFGESTIPEPPIP